MTADAPFPSPRRAPPLVASTLFALAGVGHHALFWAIAGAPEHTWRWWPNVVLVALVWAGAGRWIARPGLGHGAQATSLRGGLAAAVAAAVTLIALNMPYLDALRLIGTLPMKALAVGAVALSAASIGVVVGRLLYAVARAVDPLDPQTIGDVFD